MRKLVVGSRRSKLALTQSQQFIDKLKAVEPNLEIEIKEIVTKGDRMRLTIDLASYNKNRPILTNRTTILLKM